jgi:hypothetical protein
MAVVADAGEALSPQAADLARRIARVFLDEPADLMAELHAAVTAAADGPLRSEPVLAAEVAASSGTDTGIHARAVRRISGNCSAVERAGCGPLMDRARGGNDLQIRRVPLGVAGFLTCASFRRFAWSGSRSPRFSGFSLADPLAACGLTL